jgi:hypothetical protein
MKRLLLLVGLFAWVLGPHAADESPDFVFLKRFASFSPDKSFIATGVSNKTEFEISLHKVAGKTTELVWSNSLPGDKVGKFPRAWMFEKERVVAIKSGVGFGESHAGLIFLWNGALTRTWGVEEIFGLLPPLTNRIKAAVASGEESEGAKEFLKQVAADALKEGGNDSDETADFFKQMVAESKKTSQQRENEKTWDEDGAIARLDKIDGTNAFCLWLAGRDQWLAWSATNGASLKISDPAREELHRQTRAWSIGLITNREVLWRQSTNYGNSAASRFWPAAPFQLPEEASQIEQDFRAACRFIAKRKRPEDRLLLEKLLASGASDERLMADYLLAEWDKRLPPGREWNSSNGGQVPGDEEYVNLGRVTGNIRFGNALTNGTAWVLLIPAEWRAGAWKTKAPFMIAYEDIGYAIESAANQPALPVPNPDLADRYGVRRDKFSGQVTNVQVSFEGVVPGSYRVKAVYDGKSSAARESQPDEIPKSYQLESAEIGPIKVPAGRTIKGMTVWCTNQVASATDKATAGDRIVDSGLHPLAPLPGREEEVEVMAAVFRHIVSRHNERQADPPKRFFLATGKHGTLAEPPPELAAKLQGGPVSVKSLTDAAIENGKYVDSASHEPVPVVQLLPVKWEENRAIVPGKIFDEEDDLNLVENGYVLEHRNGKWTVLGIGPFSW